jgi:hypothetical protein
MGKEKMRLAFDTASEWATIVATRVWIQSNP